MAAIDYHRDIEPPPKPGVCVYVESYPDCDLCRAEGRVRRIAKYDAKTKHAPWAYLCRRHFKSHAAGQTLGVGKGQRLTLRRE